MKRQQPLVILDRDGVINHDSDAYIKSAKEWQPIVGSLEAIRQLKAAGCIVAVASNQSGIGRGLFDTAALDNIHAKMTRMLAALGTQLDAILYCPHTPEEHCRCRKPAPGMLIDIAARFGVPLTDIAFIGDSASDIQAARAAGARPILVLTGKGKNVAADQRHGVAEYTDLAAAVRALLEPQ